MDTDFTIMPLSYHGTHSEEYSESQLEAQK
jgi:hypothetical protein